jgi:hypothetical protein
MSNAEKQTGAQRSRVWSQHPQLSSLSAAGAVPVAGQQHLETTPGKPAIPSIRSWSRSSALERLESAATSAGMYAIVASPARGNPPGRIWEPCHSRQHACASFQGTACSHSTLLGRPAGSQCCAIHAVFCLDPPVRDTRCAGFSQRLEDGTLRLDLPVVQREQEWRDKATPFSRHRLALVLARGKCGREIDQHHVPCWGRYSTRCNPSAHA